MKKVKTSGFNTKNNRLKLLVIIIFSFILYGNTINNEYSLDDEFVVYNHKKVQKGIRAIPKIFTSSYYSSKDKKFGYRPIAQSTFAIEHSIFGSNPHLSHLVNVLLYLITCVFLFIILKKLLNKHNKILPFIITLLFMAHPLHTEVVASLKNREEILSFLGCISALFFTIKFYEKRNILNLFIGVISFIFAYLSKENAIVFIIIIPLTIYFFYDFSIKRTAFIFVLFLIVGIVLRRMISVYFPVEYSSLFFENPLNIGYGILVKLSTGMMVLGFYLKLLIFPHPLGYYYGFNMIPVEGFTLLSIALLIFHAGIFIYAIFGLKKKKLISFAILYYLFCISMFTNILLPINGIVGERLVYSASLGFSIATAILIMNISKIKTSGFSNQNKLLRNVVIILLLILIPYTAKTIYRNNDWFSHYSLYSNDIEHLENSAKANELIGNWLFEHLYDLPQNERQEAIKNIEKYYRQSLKVYSSNAQVNNNLGSLYLTIKSNPDSGVVYFTNCIKVDSTYSKAHFNLAQCYKLKRNFTKAQFHFEEAIKHDSKYVNAIAELSILHAARRNYDEAISLNNLLMELNPNSEVPYYNLGNIYILKGDTIKGLQYGEKSLEINPSNHVLSYNISSLYKMIGNMEKANFYYNLAEKYKDFNRKKTR